MNMDDEALNSIIESVIRKLVADGVISKRGPEALYTSPLPESEPGIPQKQGSVQPLMGAVRFATHPLDIDLPDPAEDKNRYQPEVSNPVDPAALKELVRSTSARIGVGRAGPRYTTRALLLFQGDHAITQDALYREVDQKLLDDFDLFTVETKVTGGKDEYLLRPDLGRQLSDEAIRTLEKRCILHPNIQLVVGDGLSAAAIEANLRQIIPIIVQGVQSAGLTFGTPFFVRHCRVGVMNDIGEALHPDVLILLIGERPGLGRAESMSAYMGYKPVKAHNDADRDVICNIFESGGTNPLEAGAYIVQLAQKMRIHQASGVKLKLAAK